MRKFLLSLGIVWIVLVGTGAAHAEDGYDLFQQALLQERVDGDLVAAIERYQRIVDKHGENRLLAATALVQIGQCWEKLGNAEAGKAYEQVLRDYADQPKQVAIARSRLAMLGGPSTTDLPSTMMTRRIWTGPSEPLFGSLDRDGRYLTFVDWSTGDLAVRELATGKVRRLTDKGPWSQSSQYALNSAVSPDGRRVVFTWADEQGDYALRTVGIDGSQPQVLYANEEVPYPTPSRWSPDGTQILALFTRRDRTNQIVLVSASDGSVRVLKTLDWRYPVGMSFSPDGRFIAYAFPRDKSTEDYDIFALAVDGSREHTLVQHPADDAWPIWTRDGTHVLFTSDRTGTTGAWAVAVVDGQPVATPKLVKPDIGRRSRPLGVTSAGSYYYGIEGGMRDVYTAEIDVATGELLTPPTKVVQRFTGSNHLPAWSPDGRYLAYVSERNRFGRPGTAQLFISIRTLETGKQREISLDLKDITAYPHLRWSPDGDSFLVTGIDEENRVGIYRIDVQTGDSTVIGETSQLPNLYFGAVWSSDGESVFYSVHRAHDGYHNGAIYNRQLESGADKKLSVEPVFAPILAVSPDGRQLAYIGGEGGDITLREEGTSVNVMPTGGGNARTLLTEPQDTIGYGPWGDLAWTPDGRQLLFTKLAPVKAAKEAEVNGIMKLPVRTSDAVLQSKIELWRISAAGGEPQRTGLAMVGLLNFQLHPDGRRIALTVASGGSEVWVMENFLAGLSASR